MSKRIMVIGAHPDDPDFRCGGIAVKYARLGYQVKFLSLTNGCGGHHAMQPDELAERRYKETQAVAQLAGIEYDVWRDSPDCELVATLENRKRLARDIRRFNPDLIICCRPNDYHADHRNCALLLQDAAYLLIVPNFCPDTPPMKKNPVIMYHHDAFQNPPFRADVIVDIDDVIEEKFKIMDCHVSQVYEWLPFTNNLLDQVPKDPEERFEWLHCPRIPRDGSALDEAILLNRDIGVHNEYREAVQSVKYRDRLIARYGEAGKKTLFSEAFELSEYGSPLSEEAAKELFPF